MPLSWLPLISDYTREAEKPFAATLVSVVVYSLVSIFMYMIGMGAAIFIHFFQNQGEMGSDCGYSDRNGCSDCLSDG